MIRRHRPSLVATGLVIATASIASLSFQAGQERHPVSGRIIAPTMDVSGAPWLERPEREREEQPGRAVEALGITRGMVVADVGAGSGYYTVRLAKAVGPDGRVYATDIQPGAARSFRAGCRRRSLPM